MENNHEVNKHLTYEERNFIEIGLNQGRNYTEIAKDINKDRRTVAREIQKHKFKKKPYVCNGCEKKSKCGKIKQYYYAKFAKDEYKEKLSKSRIGINLSKVFVRKQKYGKCRKSIQRYTRKNGERII